MLWTYREAYKIQMLVSRKPYPGYKSGHNNIKDRISVTKILNMYYIIYYMYYSKHLNMYYKMIF